MLRGVLRRVEVVPISPTVFLVLRIAAFTAARRYQRLASVHRFCAWARRASDMTPVDLDCRSGKRSMVCRRATTTPESVRGTSACRSADGPAHVSVYHKVPTAFSGPKHQLDALAAVAR